MNLTFIVYVVGICSSLDTSVVSIVCHVADLVFQVLSDAVKVSDVMMKLKSKETTLRSQCSMISQMARTCVVKMIDFGAIFYTCISNIQDLVKTLVMIMSR